MENKICCCFGHRDVYHDIEGKLYGILETLASEQGVTQFMTGGMGAFDSLFARNVRLLKRRYPQVKLLLIKPYLTADVTRQKEYYEMMYDEVIIPSVASDAHPKAAIGIRNRWMVEQSDLIVSYVCRDFGGAYTAVRYARKLQKTVINVYDALT